MGLKGFPESSKFRHLFVPGLFQLPHSTSVNTASLSLRRKRGERSKWFKKGQVTVHRKIILVGGCNIVCTSCLWGLSRHTLGIRGQFVMKVWVLCVPNDHMGVS